MPCITSDMRGELYAYMAGILRSLNSTAIQIGGVTDHVHLLIRLSHHLSLSDVVRVLKSNSARWLHQKSECYKSFAWQTGYGAFTVSEPRLNVLVSYIANQQKHHSKISFRDKFLEFLNENRIKYDERYLWD